MKLILASNSPRRKDILENHHYSFEVITANFIEANKNNNPEQTAKDNAFGKAKAVFESLTEEKKLNSVVLGADTVVCINGVILNKPIDSVDAENMLNTLSAKTHSVITACALISKNKSCVFAEESFVTFNKLTNEQIRNYVKTGKPLDKAGAYGIQDGYGLVKSYNGSLYNVIGLPIEKLIIKLKEFSLE